MKITFNENGSIIVEAKGPCVVRRDGAEEVVERPRFALCRCGHSGNKPYCDGTHKKVGFVAPRAEIELEPAP